MDNPIPALGKDEDFVAVLLDALPTPALPAHGLVPTAGRYGLHRAGPTANPAVPPEAS